MTKRARGAPTATANPWDVPKYTEDAQGDRDSKVLFAAVGEALTEWEHVEAECAELFGVLVSVSRLQTHHSPAIRAYGTVVSFRSRCEMISAASIGYFHRRKKKSSAFSQKLNRLMSECAKFSARRNEIAHGHVSEVFYIKDRRPSRNIGYMLLPSLYNPNKFKIDAFATYEYTSKDLVHFRQEFTKLHLKIAAFRRELSGKPS